jgi:glycerate kinase
MSDGGDGFGEVIGRLLGARRIRCRTVDAAHRPVTARWWWHSPTRTAVIESAEVIGLAMLPRGRFHPFELDTQGLAAPIRAAQRLRARRIVVGIGGSATNDGGFGVARGLGWKFFDAGGQEIVEWTRLTGLARVESAGFPEDCEIHVATDVRNPLLGPNGATRIYGPQKGLRPGDYRVAEACLLQLARVAGPREARRAGAGAAGGLGFGLMAFLNATPMAGFDLFAEIADLDNRLQRTDLVISGEGAIDASTRMGKGVGQLAIRCRRWRVPCIGVAGVVRPAARRWRVWCGLVGMTDFHSDTYAMQQPVECLVAAAARAAQNCGQSAV